MNRIIFGKWIFLLFALLPAVVFADVVFPPEMNKQTDKEIEMFRQKRQVYTHVTEDGRLEMLLVIGMHGTGEYTLRSLTGGGEEGPLVSSNRYENESSVPLAQSETVKLPELGENGTARYRFEAVCRPKIILTDVGIKETAREERVVRDFVLRRQNGLYRVVH